MSSQQPEPVQSSDSPQPTVSKLESDSVSGGTGARFDPRDGALVKSKKEKKPVSISGFKSSVSATSSASTLPGKKPLLPASSLIYQDTDVGVDLGSMRRAASHATGFVRPADVDAPPPSPQPPKSAFSVDESDQVEEKKRTLNTSDSSALSTAVQEERSRKKKRYSHQQLAVP